LKVVTTLKEQIAEFIREKAYRPMTADELKAAMGVTERNAAHFIKTLQQMESNGEVVQTRLDRYGAPEKMNLAVGRLQGHPKGFGFLISDQAGVDDTFIGREGLGGALHNDRVVVRLSPPTRPGGRAEGEVIRVLRRVRNPGRPPNSRGHFDSQGGH
jgi:ribonuclease R